MGRYVFKLPDVGEGTAEAELVGWHVKAGDEVSEDQLIADVMTDKATVEITSPVSGRVTRLHGEPGQMIAVRGPLAEFEVEGAGNASAEAQAPEPEAPETAAPETAAKSARESEPAPAPAGVHAGIGKVFKLPDVGEGTAEAELVAWHVKIGDQVHEDQILAEVMTDKATVEITSPFDGTIAVLHGTPGQALAVGGPLVSFAGDGAAPAAKAETGRETPSPAKASPPAPSASRPAQEVQERARQPQTPGVRPLASPAVRARAHDMGIALQFVPGSGPAGRIDHGDLDAYLATRGQGISAPASSPSGYQQAQGTSEVRIIGLRRKIAEKMAESVRRIPHITYVEEIDVTALEELRAHLNAEAKKTGRAKLNVLPFIARAIVVALRDQPQINAHYDDEAGILTQHAAVHLGIAAQTPSGLMVPVVRHAEARDPYDTAAEIARLAEAAKSGTAKREELTGSTITITSLGTLGGVVHTPIINHPEVAIVGPNKIQERVVVRDGQMVVRKMMNLSSSFDHRIVDGHDAAVFVQRIKGLLEHPATLWMG
ncbi:MAG: 2-oxo acid dehydrogenase subunit E2 [Brevundimonas sp.]|jgi:2-oxoisovalerate dehydrogenase E2 component (dihydrolipoyl transacylase)|uniref:2-oxo acid dehydrogenase subunit E2 n=1 Tax=Brevundimonas sp. TaxID=1871086 RepID=UPI00391C2BFE